MSTKEMRELDAWIHEHVFGKCLFDEHRINNALCRKCCMDCSSETHRVKSPTTDPAAAMEVLRICAKKDVTIQIRKQDSGEWCVWDVQSWSDGTASTLELAICLYAKKLFTK